MLYLVITQHSSSAVKKHKSPKLPIAKKKGRSKVVPSAELNKVTVLLFRKSSQLTWLLTQGLQLQYGNRFWLTCLWKSDFRGRIWHHLQGVMEIDYCCYKNVQNWVWKCCPWFFQLVCCYVSSETSQYSDVFGSMHQST